MKLELLNWARVITPSDTVDFAEFTQKGLLSEWIYVGGTGNLVGVLQDGSTVLISAIPVGAQLPLALRRINSTSTTATLIVAGFRI